jgi:hypothetical protein
VAGKLGLFQAVNYRVRRVPLKRELRDTDLQKIQEKNILLIAPIIMTTLRVP